MNISRDAIVVLHVDDDPQVRELLGTYFEQLPGNISVISASDGADSLARIDDEIDCVVSDYHMPKMDGIELLQEVRDVYPDLPFILLTGMGSERVASEAISAGATDYFQKADTLDDVAMLAQRIENVVARRRAEVSYLELFEKASEGFALHDPETGAFIDANASVQRILGYARAELLGMVLDDVTTVPTRVDQERPLVAHLRRATEDEAVALEECCRHRDGTTIWIRLRLTSIEVGGRTLVLSQLRDITERKRYEETLSALHTSMADMVGAEQPRQVSDCVRTAIDDLVEAEHAAIFLHNVTANRLTLETETDIQGVPAVSDPSIPLSADSPLTRAFLDGTTIETTSVTVFDSVSESRQSSRSLLLPLGDHGVLVIGTDEPAFGDDVREFAEILAGAAAVAFDRIRKTHEIHSSREALRSQTNEMEQLTRTNSMLQDLSSALLQTSTVEDAHETVCEALETVDSVELAWVGVPGDGTLDAAVWSGAIPQYLDEAVFDPASSEPAARVVRTGEPVRVDNTAQGIRDEPWRRTALTHDVGSVLAIPIEVGGMTCGVLSVLGSGQSAFDDDFTEMMSTIATWVGETVYSIEQRQGMLTPTPATVTYQLAASEHFLGRLAADVGGRIDVQGTVTEAADRHRLFITVTDADATRVCALANELTVVRTADVVTSMGDGGALELQVITPLLGVALVQYTAEVSDFWATETSVEATVTVARPTDVRGVAEAIRGRYSGATLLSKREHADPLEEYERVRSFREALTPRQLEVVQTAYLNGYFDSPRRCTGDELGEQLDISSQAVYQHLRAVQRTLFDEVFDGLLDASANPSLSADRPANHPG